MSCLRRIKSQDPRVPVIAISGVATPEIAAQLLRGGADDYLDKQGLRPETLAQSIETALARRRAWERSTNPPLARLRALLKQFRRRLRELDPVLVGLADSLAEASAELPGQALVDLMNEVCPEGPAAVPDRLLRGMLRELMCPETKPCAGEQRCPI